MKKVSFIPSSINDTSEKYRFIAAGLVVVLVVVGVLLKDTLRAPVEHKVVEIHFTRAKTAVEESRKAKTAKLLPLANYGICSGEFVNDLGDILTAKHCTDQTQAIEVITWDQKHYVGTVVRQSPSHDLSLVHIDRTNTPHFDLASSLKRGEKIYALGSPLGITDTLSQGFVAKLDGDTTLIDCGVLPGNSGCPLINQNGELVGTITAGYVVYFGTTHLNLAQSLDVIKFFLAGF